MGTFTSLPPFSATTDNVVRKIDFARGILEGAGGADTILTQIASGTKMLDLSKELRVSIAHINAFLRATCDPADVEAAMASQIRTRIEILDDEAGNIEDLKKRFDAKKELLFWQAEKETEKYKAKQAESSRGGVTINIDWSQFETGAVTAKPYVDV